MSTVVTLTVVAVVMNGLVAGVFFAYSTFTMQGLARPPAAVGIAAMQGINASAQRSPLLVPLFVAPLVGIAAAVLAVTGAGDEVHGTGAVVGAVAGIVPAAMTAAFHIPRNDGLDRVDPRAADAPAAWERYLREWVAGNHLRTVGGLVGMTAMALALVA